MKIIPVAAGILENPQGEILFARRTSPPELAGLWEFPGGKIETGESVADALQRELHEELGIDANQFAPLMTVHTPLNRSSQNLLQDRLIELHVMRVIHWSGEPHSREGQALQWVARSSLLNDLPMPPLDIPIARALCWPREILVTPEIENESEWLDRLERALARGVPWVHLRSTRTSAQLRALAYEARALTRANGVKFSINQDLNLALEVAADGVHFKSSQLASLSQFDLLAIASYQSNSATDFLVGASCHTAIDLQRAEQLGLDYTLIAPVLPTLSHPNSAALGWDGFMQLKRTSALPAYALGGLSQNDLPIALQHGALGIAAIRGLWD